MSATVRVSARIGRFGALGLLLIGLGCCVSPQQRLVRSLAQQGLWHEARIRLEAELTRQPENAELHNDLAICLEALGEFDSALREYERASALAPADAAIRGNLVAAKKLAASPRPTPGGVPP